MNHQFESELSTVTTGASTVTPPFPSCPFPFLSLSAPPHSRIFPPFEVGPHKPSGDRGALGSSKGTRKQFWCSLKLSESHLWQTFSVFWTGCFYKIRPRLREWRGVAGCWGGVLTPSSPSAPSWVRSTPTVTVTLHFLVAAPTFWRW